jgi:NAD(P)-dependent dehydrogenase (short-subunit alcohol dehydrogenase family)
MCEVAIDCFKMGIRVNSVAPSYVETGMMESIFRDSPGLREVLERQLPLGRMAVPEEVAGPVLFLLSEDASYVNGVTLPVDSGLSLFLRQTV